MTLAPWRSPIARALHRNRSLPYARYLQLATVRPDARPANRTVVFRGFLDGTNQLQFITDARSDKLGQIEHQPWAEACWYFPTTREQFRLLGQLAIGTDDPDSPYQQARQTLWHNLSDSARIQFAWAHPGKPRAADDDFAPPPPDPQQPLPHFRLLLLDPTEVDHLELRGSPQNRYRYAQTADRQWQVQEINP